MTIKDPLCPVCLSPLGHTIEDFPLDPLEPGKEYLVLYCSDPKCDYELAISTGHIVDYGEGGEEVGDDFYLETGD